MKKVLSSVIAASLMSTALLAGITGKSTEVVVKDNSIVTVSATDGTSTKTNPIQKI